MEKNGVQMIPLHFQQVHLLGQRSHGVKVRHIQDLFDFPQRKLKLPKEQDGLHSRRGCIVIQPVTRVRYFRGLQQSDGIIVVERGDAPAGDTDAFLGGFLFSPSRRMSV